MTHCHCSVIKLCTTLCDPMDCSTPGFPVLHSLLEFTQTHIRWIADAIQPSHPLLPLILVPSIFPSIRVFYNKAALRIRCPKYWSFSISPSNEYSGLNSFRIDWFDFLAAQSTRESSPAPQCKSINSSVLSLLYGPTLTFIHDYRKNQSFVHTHLYP